MVTMLSRRKCQNCGFWTRETHHGPPENSHSLNRDPLVQGARGIVGAETVHGSSGHLGHRLHLHRNVHAQALLHGKRLRNITNLSNFLGARHPVTQTVARTGQTPRREGLLSALEAPIAERTASANLRKGDRGDREDAIAEPLGEDNRAGGAEPVILPLCGDLIVSFYNGNQSTVK